MKTVSISKLREKLPHYLSLARRGETVRITSRNKTIAQIGPASAPEDEVAAARASLRGSVLRYDDPLEPVMPSEEWDMEK